MWRLFSLIQRIGIVGGLALSLGGLVLDARDYAALGLPPLAWAAIGVAIVVASTFTTMWDLYRQNIALKDQRASLEIFFERQFPMWWPEQPWYRVGVRNNSHSAQAEDVEVKLEGITPSSPLPLNVLPARLGRKDGGTDDCRINPGAEEYFDVVQGVPLEPSSAADSLTIVSPRGPRSLAIWTVPAAGQLFELDPSVEYQLQIQVTGRNARPDKKVFGMRPPAGAELEFWLPDQELSRKR